MTKLLQEAFRKASALPAERQDQLAGFFLEEMARDEQWDATLTSPESLALLDGWAAEALWRADFTPTLWQQQPVEVWIQVPITFSPR